MIGCGFSSLQIFVRMLNFSDPLSSRSCSNYQEHMKNLQMKVRGKQETIQKNLNNMSQRFAYFQVMARLMKQNRKTWKEYDFGKTNVSFSKNFFRVFGVFFEILLENFLPKSCVFLPLSFHFLILPHIFDCLCSSSTCRFAENMSHISLPITI